MTENQENFTSESSEENISEVQSETPQPTAEATETAILQDITQINKYRCARNQNKSKGHW
jgi:hypothetical protein